MINVIRRLFNTIKGNADERNVALVLGGGGARGYAHIGAIDSLLEHDYNITSIAGTSMGALVGGIYAAGKFNELKDIVESIKRKTILQLIDISPGLDHLATADKLKELLNSMTGNIAIENLDIDFCCSASDIADGREHVFRSGSLSDAIRASISIPCVFSPVKIGGHIYVDGSVHNTLPLNRVERHKGDLLVAVNASAPDDPSLTKQHDDKFSDNYVSMAMRVCQVAIQNNTLMAEQITPPDVIVNIPMNRFGLFDFESGKEIIAYGHAEMDKQLAELEKSKKR